MNLSFISHPSCHEHRMGAHHPECPERLYAIQDRLIASGMEMLVTHYDAPEASVEQLASVHDRGYIEGIFEAAPQATDVLSWIDGDTAMNQHSLEAALRSAGAAMRSPIIRSAIHATWAISTRRRSSSMRWWRWSAGSTRISALAGGTAMPIRAT